MGITMVMLPGRRRWNIATKARLSTANNNINKNVVVVACIFTLTLAFVALSSTASAYITTTSPTCYFPPPSRRTELSKMTNSFVNQKHIRYNNIRSTMTTNPSNNQQIDKNHNKHTLLLRRMKSFLQRYTISTLFQQIHLRQKIRMIVTTALLMCTIATTSLQLPCTTSSSSFKSSSIAHAATAATTSSTTNTEVFTERILDQISSSNVDRIIDSYVQKHMFDDDTSVHDPVAGAYREAYYDQTTNIYPNKLRNIVSEAFRNYNNKLESPIVGGSVVERAPIDVGYYLTRVVQLLQSKMGLSEFTATIVLAISFVLAGPTVFLLFGMIVGGISKRNMDQVFKKRYGSTYTVDATIKQEPRIELPSDEDDDDDDDDNEGDDDDDDDDLDEDGDDKTINKNRKKK